MDMTDPLVRKHAKESFRWLEISRVNGELGVSRAFGDYDYKVRGTVANRACE